MSTLCPKCDRILYSRKHKQCGYCGAELPPELLFSPEELDALKRMENDAEEEHIKWKEQKDKEKENRNRNDIPWVF